MTTSLMPIVSNTSPILNLAIIDRLLLLREQFGQVIIPTVVLKEFKLAEKYPGARQIESALDSGWINVTKMDNEPVARLLQLELDAGEAAAIALAVAREDTQILIDEREGRQRAKALGLQPIGAIGILLRAKKIGKITSMKSEIHALRTKAGFHLSDRFVADILAAAGEADN